MVAALIGAPVFSKDGAEVGRVADIAFDGELQPKALRMVTGIPMGLGTTSDSAGGGRCQSSRRFCCNSYVGLN